ncbi:DNA-binding FadR family transcriptional regulator [Nitrospirillum amazonense]|uniref:DNA-binding FadR family transcriptional regulator n=1 Tax=Nitrospirillum amazonense TaxID=28077 RepID=A0A560EL74_9PROT|nr:FCD domain-containing protein [Nitrospirillum amazonense]TWB10094.1 DNA-binding FadR family transcriptional regulator [Nitrospirillum amazonense]
MSTATPLPQAPRTSLVESTIGLIRTQIESGAWKVGGRIPREPDLADMLQVGRNTVREAIRVLSHAQVLEVRQGDGTYVRSSVDPAEVMRRVSHSSLRDHFELRAILETEAARLAATRRTDEDLERLGQLLHARGDAPVEGDLAGFVDRDFAFHAAVATAAHNTALTELYRYFSVAVRQNTQAVLVEQELPEPGLAAHARIVDAIERQDSERAAKAARAVMAPVITKLTELLGG